MNKCPQPNIPGIVCANNGASRRDNPLGGLHQLHLFAKGRAIQSDVGTAVGGNIGNDGIAATVRDDSGVRAEPDVV